MLHARIALFIGFWLTMTALVVVPLGLIGRAAFPLALVQAKHTWERQRPAHYQIEVRWRSGGYVAHQLLEVRHEQIVGGTDLITQAPLTRVEIGIMSHMFPVRQTFAQIEAIEAWPPTWRGRLARIVPWFAHHIDPCAVPPPVVNYDPQFGYPTFLRAQTNPCFNGVGFEASIDAFAPLP
jgi:hypothetical protein